MFVFSFIGLQVSFLIFEWFSPLIWYSYLIFFNCTHEKTKIKLLLDDLNSDHPNFKFTRQLEKINLFF